MKCVSCEPGEYEKSFRDVAICINPNGEYVKGYGMMPVSKMIRIFDIEKCPKCGHIKGVPIIDTEGEILVPGEPGWMKS
jgi:hypothetical protein